MVRLIQLLIFIPYLKRDNFCVYEALICSPSKSDKQGILHRMRNIKLLGVFLALTVVLHVAHTATLSLASSNEPIYAIASAQTRLAIANTSAPMQKKSTTQTTVKSSAQTPPAVTAPNTTMQSNTPKTELAWADVLEQSPNPKVVTNADFLARIAATGLPWRVKDKATGIEMLLVPPGKFIMGLSPGDKEADDDEKPAHEVTLTNPFYLGRTEVTQAQWVKVAGNNPSHFHSASDRDSMIKKLMNEGLTKSEAEVRAAKKSTDKDPLPVESISWNVCQQFCAKTNLRLPTEAEWEYACRAGVRKPTYGDLDDIAWNINSRYTTHIVGKKLPNALGFYDMLGNVWEWCSDIYGEKYYKSCEDGVVDPKGASEGLDRVLRGGGWRYDSICCRSSDRCDHNPGYRDNIIGFRVARTP